MSWLNKDEFVIYLHQDDYAAIAEWMFPENFSDDDDENKGLTPEQIEQVKTVKNAVYEVGIVVNLKTGKIRLNV